MVLRFHGSCGKALGVEWVTIATLAEESGLVGEVPRAFLADFRTRVLGPALAHLQALRQAADDLASMAALHAFQAWIQDLQTPHLGAVFTHDAIRAAGAVSIHGDSPAGAWVQGAQDAVSRAAWWSCPHAAVSSQGVVAWAAMTVDVCGVLVEEPGRVFLADDSAEHSILVERMLQPLFLQVPRNGHAERRALVSCIRVIGRAFGRGEAESWGAVCGELQLYASHYLCISCLAATAQFSRRLPQVRLVVAFDNAWASWAERSIEVMDPAALVIGRGG